MKNADNQLKQTATITYTAPREINIGDVFYKIKAADHHAFREPCLVCKGEKELTINGITFSYPYCGRSEEVLRIPGYVVQKLRVFKIEDEVNNSERKPGTNHRVRFGLYRKAGHGYQWADHSETTLGELDFERWLNFSKEEANEYNADNLIFDDYRLAVLVAKYLTEKQLKKLDEYNALHGTSHEAKFITENDPKSK